MSAQVPEEHAIVLADWPQPAVVAELRAYADESSLLIRYRGASEGSVVARFPLCHYMAFGAPNDKALGGHPLANRGLKFYSVHEVVNSTLLQMLERRNSVHPRHDRESYLRGKRHYVFTFQDSTLECVVTEGEWWKPTIGLFASDSEADIEWRRQVNAEPSVADVTMKVNPRPRDDGR